MIPEWVDAQVILAAGFFLLAILAGCCGYVIGRAFNREEFMAMQLLDITLRGALERETIRTRDCERRCLELTAALEHKSLLESALMVPPAGVSPGQ